jgi:hypothetical protein
MPVPSLGHDRAPTMMAVNVLSLGPRHKYHCIQVRMAASPIVRRALLYGRYSKPYTTYDHLAKLPTQCPAHQCAFSKSHEA